MIKQWKYKKNFTTISTYHFWTKKLSLQAIGILSFLLQLPEDWEYSVKGLTELFTNGKSSINNILKELEENGYIERIRQRYSNGRLKGIDYIVYPVTKDELEKYGFEPK